MPIKYCYTPDQGFYLNPDWEEPNQYGISNAQLLQIQANYTAELIEQGCCSMEYRAFVRSLKTLYNRQPKWVTLEKLDSLLDLEKITKEEYVYITEVPEITVEPTDIFELGE